NLRPSTKNDSAPRGPKPGALLRLVDAQGTTVLHDGVGLPQMSPPVVFRMTPPHTSKTAMNSARPPAGWRAAPEDAGRGPWRPGREGVWILVPLAEGFPTSAA